MSKIFKMYFKDSVRGIIAIVVALLIVCPLSILFILVPLWENSRYGLGDWVLIAAGVIWILIFLGGITVIILTVNIRRKRWLDSIFTPLGMVGRRYMINWWEYCGTIQGREVKAQYYRGPTFHLSVQTRIKTRFGVVETDQPGLFLAELSNTVPLQTGIPWLQPITVFAIDKPWTAEVLSNEGAAKSLQQLMSAGESWALIRQVLLIPGMLRLVLYRNKNLVEHQITPEEVRLWLEDLFALVQLAESFPPPTVTAEESRVEAAVRTGKATTWGVLILVGFFGFCGVAMGALLWLLVKFGG